MLLEQMGSVTKVQRPKVVVYAWVGVGAAVVPRGRTLVVIGTLALAPKVGKMGAGGMMVIKL
jgi:hypothetical protein